MNTPTKTHKKMADIDVTDVLSHANIDWSPLGESFVKCYMNYDDLDWTVDFARQKAAVAPYGGSVAVLFKTPSGSMIRIYTLAGKSIGTIKLEGGKIVGLGWTSSENLILIYDDGTIVVYTVLGERKFQRLLAHEIREQRILDCKFFHTVSGSAGFAVMTYNFQFFVVSDSDRDQDSLRVKALAELPSSSTCPSCWTVLTSGNNVGVVAAVEDRLYHLQQLETLPITIACKEPNRIWTSISISLNSKAAALIDKNGFIWAGSSDFKVQETEFDLQSSAKVLQMEWSGNDFIVILFEKFIFLKGLGKHWCKLPSRGPAVLTCEIDGVRIVSNNSCEFLHRVATSSLAVLKVASLQPGAILNDAYKEFEGDESHKADEYVRYIKDKLPDAIVQCCHAASEEFDTLTQQALLMSANFGKGFLGPEVTPDIIRLFVETCRYLRVLNFVRHPNIGIPLTYRQFVRLTPGVLIDRLVNHTFYPLALEICNYLKIPSNTGEAKVLRQWAFHKVKDTSVPEKDIAYTIFKRFQESGVVASFTEIAREAKQEGRGMLAAQLLEHEVLVRDQVQLLLEMNETDKALDKAIDSLDAQLVYEVLEKMKDTQRTSDYMKIFNHRPIAAALYKKYCKENNLHDLINLYRQESDFLGAGVLLLSQSYDVKPGANNRLLPDQGKMKESYKEFIDGQLPFHIRVIEDHNKLAKEQEILKKECGFDVTGCTLFDTVLECVRRGRFREADALKKKFAMTDSIFWWAKLKGLSEVANFEELEKFSKQKKSPIGYEPFVDVCLRKNRFKEAVKYIPRCPPHKRCKLYMATGEWHKAADAAFADKNIAALDEMLARQGRSDPALVDHIRQIKVKLGVV